MLPKSWTVSKLNVRHRHFRLQLPEPNQWQLTESAGLSYNKHSCSGLHVRELLTLLECYSPIQNKSGMCYCEVTALSQFSSFS